MKNKLGETEAILHSPDTLLHHYLRHSALKKIDQAYLKWS